MSEKNKINGSFREALIGLYVLCAAIVVLILWQSVFSVGTQQIGLIWRFGEIQRVVGEGTYGCFPAPIERTQMISARVKTLTSADADLTVLAADGFLLRLTQAALVYAPELQNQDGLLNFYGRIALDEREKLLTFLLRDALIGAAQEFASDSILRNNAAFCEGVAQKLQATFLRLNWALDCRKISVNATVSPELKASYDAVSGARAESEKYLSEARRKVESRVNRARIDGESLIADAQGEALERCAQARAKAEAFTLALHEYARAPELYQRRRLNEAWQNILRSARSRMVLPQGSGKTLYLRIPNARTTSKKSDGGAQ